METNLALFLSSRRATSRILICIALLTIATSVLAEQVRVAQRQGFQRGFLVLKDQDGKEIAVGDETNEVRGGVVHARTVFHFRDGSIDDEETWYRQNTTFQLIRDHRIQKGPSYPKPSDITIDVPKGEVTWVDESDKSGDDGSKQSKSKQMKLPADLSNGMVPLLIQNLPRRATEMKLSYLAVDTKPRIVTLDIKPDGTDKVLVGVDGREADRFNIHTDIGGIAGVVAPIVGEQPPDIKMWFVGGAISTFVRMQGPFYQKGPVWTVYLTAPTWSTEEQKGD
jgi:hypothetical protein